MKWFKHYSNAHTNDIIESLLAQKNGHELHSMYWLFMELLCEEFKNDTVIFKISTNRIMSALRIRYERKLKSFFSNLVAIGDELGGNCFTITPIDDKTSGKFYSIETSIILDLMGKSFKQKPLRSLSKAPKKEERRKKNKNIKASVKFDFEGLYNLYPKKQGKTKGLAICVRDITTPPEYLKLKQCIENYGEQCKFEETEKKYIKQFSTFMNCYQDYETLDFLDERKKAESLFGNPVSDKEVPEWLTSQKKK